jgi:GT2 family glycosyltransferase
MAESSHRPLPTRTAVVVLGVHRSGTSVISRGLAVLGAHLGQRLMPPAPDNPTGYWENLGINEVNEGVLAALGAAWDSVAELDWSRLDEVSLQIHRHQALRALQTEFGALTPIAFKDPRLPRLLPVWQPVLPVADLDARYLIVIRNPVSVARSLQARNGFVFEKSYLLWLLHVIPSLVSTRGRPRAIIDYDHFMRDPVETLLAVATALGLELADGAPARLREYSTTFVSEALRHAVFDEKALGGDERIVPVARHLYEVLQRVVSGRLGLDEASVDQVIREARLTLETFRPALAWLDALDRTTPRLREEIREHRGLNARLRDDLDLALQREHRALSTVAAEREAARAELARLQSDLEAHALWLASLEHARDALRGERDAATVERDQAVRERAQRGAAHDQAVRERDAVAGELAEAVRERDQAQLAHERARRELDLAVREREGMTRQRDQVRTALEQAHREIAQATAERNAARAAAGELRRQLDLTARRGEQVEVERDDAFRARDQAAVVAEGSRAQLDELAARLAAADAQRAALEGEVGRLSEALADRESHLQVPLSSRWGRLATGVRRLTRRDGPTLTRLPASSPGEPSLPVPPSPVAAAGAAGTSVVARPTSSPRSRDDEDGGAPIPDSDLAAAREHGDDYADLAHQIRAAEQRRIETLRLAPRSLIAIAPQAVPAHADALSFVNPDHPRVSIVVPVFNNIQLTLECLTALSLHTEPTIPYEVIVADDASTDETSDVLARIRGLRVVRNHTNLGFLRNCNRAAALARGPYLLFLNSDVQVCPGWLAPLVSCLEGHPAVGAVGPKLLYPDGRLQEAGALINPDGTATLVGLFDDPTRPAFNRQREVDYTSAACLLVRRDLFLDVGGFSDDLAPAYCEDSDLCFKLCEQGHRIVYCPSSEVVHRLSQTVGTLGGDYKARIVARNRQTLLSRWQARIDELNRVRVLAFYLPQFHPIPENDAWWGKGFTEWTKVVKARPNFDGHYQPHRPADLGYYDLRVPEVMAAQARLAQRYGLHGFCYYYYWFGGRRLLEVPLERMLASGQPDIPFCLCWANENWTRRWDGEDQEILIAQRHSPEDDEAVFRDILRYLRSPNYIRIGDRPLILVYRVDLFPDFGATADRWRHLARQAGLGDVYVAMVESFGHSTQPISPGVYGCDAAVEFPPHGFGDPRPPAAESLNRAYRGAVHDYREMVLRYVRRPSVPYVRFRGVMPSWDNTPRLQNEGHAFINTSPGYFQAWLEHAVQETRVLHVGSERLVFVNAWNEWAEGAHLEPDERHGHAWLEAVANALDRVWLKP